MQNVNQHKHGNSASRRRILGWINNNLGTTYVRLEELRSGAEYCRMLHKLQPSAIKLKKVFKEPKSHYECVQNMKLLQKSLLKQGVEKQIPIQRLVSRGNSESLEFAQWFKAFYDHNHQLLWPEKTEDAPKPLEKFDEKPDSFVDTGKCRYGARCSHRLDSTVSSRHSNQSGKNFENYQKKKTTTTGSNSVGKSENHRKDDSTKHPLWGSLEDFDGYTPEVFNKTYRAAKKYKIVKSRFIRKHTKRSNKPRNSKTVRIAKSENQKSESAPSIDDPDIVLATEVLASGLDEPRTTQTYMIKVPGVKLGYKPNLFQYPEIIEDYHTILAKKCLLFLDDVHVSFDLDLGELSTLTHDIHRTETNLKKSDEERVSLIAELDSSPDEWSSTWQSTYENALPIDVIDFKEQHLQQNQSNNCNCADITVAGELPQSTEIDLKKIDPEETSRCKNSNGPLLGKRLDRPLPRTRPFKLRRTFGFHEEKSVKIKSFKYSIKKLVDESPPNSSDEECFSDDFPDVSHFNKEMDAKIVSIWKDIYNVIKILQRIEQNWYRSKINESRTTFKHWKMNTD